MDDSLYKYYEMRQDHIEDEWDEYLHSNDWGSGDDRIRITEAIFWEFVEDLRERDIILD